MDTKTSTKKKSKGAKTELSSEEIVSKCLQSYTELKPLKDSFIRRVH